MINKIRNMIKRAVITLGGTDDKELPIQQLSYNGKVADAEIIFPYGVHANLSADNNTLCVLFAVDGQEDSRVAMGYTPGLRPKPLAEGEVVFYHPLTQSKIHFRNNGDIDVTAPTTNWIGDINLTGNLNITGTSTADDHISDGISGNSHVHGGVESGTSNTDEPQ